MKRYTKVYADYGVNKYVRMNALVQLCGNDIFWSILKFWSRSGTDGGVARLKREEADKETVDFLADKNVNRSIAPWEATVILLSCWCEFK